MDIDGDGRDEMMAGYAMLNPDGSVRWVYQSEMVDLKHGRLDGARVFRKAASPEDFRIVGTCCGANNIVMLDETCLAASAVPELVEASEHYEGSILKADMTGDGVPGLLLVTPDMAYVYRNENGRRPEGGFPLGTGVNVTLYSARFHCGGCDSKT